MLNKININHNCLANNYNKILIHKVPNIDMSNRKPLDRVETSGYGIGLQQSRSLQQICGFEHLKLL